MYNITVSCSQEHLDDYLLEYCGSGWKIKNIHFANERIYLDIVASGEVSKEKRLSRIKKVKEIVRWFSGY